MRVGLNYKYLAKNKGPSISILSTYIMFLTKLQKRQIPEKGFALLKNDITKILKHKKTFDKLQISVIWVIGDKLEVSKLLEQYRFV